MTKTLKTAMKTSISEILEKMFYISYEFDETSSLQQSKILTSTKPFSCRLDFTGPFSGYFVLFLPESLLFDLTENFMGLEKNKINEHHIKGTIKELINMTAGSTFSNYDNEAVFHLHIPELIEFDKLSDSSLKPDSEEIFVLTETTHGYLGLKLIYNSIYE